MRAAKTHLHGEDGAGELGHRVHALGKVANHRLDVRGELGAVVELGSEALDIIRGG